METHPGYTVEIHDAEGGWRVTIVEEGGGVVSERRCRDGAEARTYASTVRQHLHWLSPSKFREYYRIEGSGGSSGVRDRRERTPREQA